MRDAKKYLKDNKHNINFVPGHHLFLKGHRFGLQSWKTVSFEEQKISADKYLNKFLRKMEAIAYIKHLSNILTATVYHLRLTKRAYARRRTVMRHNASS